MINDLPALGETLRIEGRVVKINKLALYGVTVDVVQLDSGLGFMPIEGIGALLRLAGCIYSTVDGT